MLFFSLRAMQPAWCGHREGSDGHQATILPAGGVGAQQFADERGHEVCRSQVEIGLRVILEPAAGTEIRCHVTGLQATIDHQGIGANTLAGMPCQFLGLCLPDDIARPCPCQSRRYIRECGTVAATCPAHGQGGQPIQRGDGPVESPRPFAELIQPANIIAMDGIATDQDALGGQVVGQVYAALAHSSFPFRSGLRPATAQ